MRKARPHNTWAFLFTFPSVLLYFWSLKLFSSPYFSIRKWCFPAPLGSFLLCPWPQLSLSSQICPHPFMVILRIFRSASWVSFPSQNLQIYIGFTHPKRALGLHAYWVYKDVTASFYLPSPYPFSRCSSEPPPGAFFALQGVSCVSWPWAFIFRNLLSQCAHYFIPALSPGGD
jgi:hypothetical protein